MATVDVHQHLYPEPVLRALEARCEAPFARWHDGAFLVTPAGEAAFTVQPSAHDPGLRARTLRAAGIDRALVALSSAIGVETLAPAEAEPVLDAWQQASVTLPGPLAAWGAIALRDRPEDQVTRAAAALDAGAAGICIPAGALAAGPAAIDRLGPVLDLLQARLAPLFVHPGAVTATGTSRPEWWAPATTYVAELQAAWLAFVAHARPAHPSLRVLFAALAGLAPLHAERTAARGGPPVAATADPGIYYDTSSYGPRAIRALTSVVGTTQLVEGSDHPVLPLTPHAPMAPTTAVVRADNTARLLGLTWSAA